MDPNKQLIDKDETFLKSQVDSLKKEYEVNMRNEHDYFLRLRSAKTNDEIADCRGQLYIIKMELARIAREIQFWEDRDLP